ncbi:hypothetical protein BDW22DRAFT_1353259 [Trametopsis cervina]|nr:hypothetical protein BDW22DRAFT_1353259 [Trametopsis cervina]
MEGQQSPTKPAWQIEELEEEWIDLEEEEDEHSESQANASFQAHTTSDLSLTQIHGAILSDSSNADRSSASSAGTVLVREDQPVVPFLPQTPLGNAKKGFSKNFFSPLALERMFEPPSPPLNEPPTQPPVVHKNAPAVPSRLSRVYVPSESEFTSESLDQYMEGVTERSEDAKDDEYEPADEPQPETTKYQFTFAAPSLRAARAVSSTGNPSTPVPLRAAPFTPTSHLVPPATDPRLKLFQFQYDTFTRDHLSAMVDSIAIHSPTGDSGTANSKDSSPTYPAFASPSDTSLSRLRSAKRLKLSPASDFSGDGQAMILRPQDRKDYVGESKSLMDKIRQARDFSTISTHTSANTPHSSDKRTQLASSQAEAAHNRVSYLNVPAGDNTKEGSSAWNTASSKRSMFSSVQFREQAADLMAQIRNDVRSHKRLFSVDSEATPVKRGYEEEQETHSDDSVDIEPINYGGDTELLSDFGEERTEVLYATNAPGTRSGREAGLPNQARDVNDELSRSVGQMSLESPSLLDQFPPLPIKVIVSSSSTSSQGSWRGDAPPDGQKGLKPTYLSPNADGIALTRPSTSSRVGLNPDDLNRFVSSSTASGATIGSGTPASIVRHEGRPIKLITPDSQTIPERLGEMVFDQHLMKWVKSSSSARDTYPTSGTMKTSGSNESEDPFRDIESLNDDTTPTSEDFNQNYGQDDHPISDTSSSMDLDTSRVHELPSDSEVEDAEEVELTSFSFDGNSLQSTASMHENVESRLDTESEDDLTARRSEGTGQFVRALADSFAEPVSSAGPASDSRRHVTEAHQSGPALQDTPPHLLAPPSSSKLTTPLPSRTANSVSTPVIRSALKSNSVTPVSALRDVSRPSYQTPANRLIHKRSVSFSDGKREGPIVGIGRNIPTPDVTTESDGGSISDVGSVEPSGALVPSARSKRIADMLEDLEDTSYEDESPSKASSGKASSAEELLPLQRRQNAAPPWSSGSGSGRARPRRSFSQSHSSRSLKFTPGNATFLTECSFGVAHDRLVQVITDVQPFEPYWEGLSSIDLSRKELDSVARLKEFLPKLDSLMLNSNQLAWLSGIPGTVRTLSVASNCLTAVTSFSHLLNLESLDISRNNIDSLRQLDCLRHLRELRADGNMIDSVDGLQKMDGLVKLSLQGNYIQDVDLTNYRWSRLEMLNLSQNRLSRINGISSQSLPALIALNLDHNNLRELQVEGSMARLKILRVSGNRLQQFNAGPFANLRTLYADNNSLGPVHKAHRLTKLENLSLRNQSGRAGLSLSIQDVRDVKRLYLSGNPMKPGFISEPCYNLVYLELAACRLTTLPADLARLVPNVRVLNLNYNFLEDVRPLQGLTRLRKLTVIGSRVRATREFVRMLKGMLDVEMLDLRMNPCTLGWYLPLLVKDVPGALQPSDGGGGDRRAGGGGRGAATSSSSSSAAVKSERDAAAKRRIEFNVSAGVRTAARGANADVAGAASDDDDGLEIGMIGIGSGIGGRDGGAGVRGGAAQSQQRLGHGHAHAHAQAQVVGHQHQAAANPTTADGDADADPLSLLPPPGPLHSTPRSHQPQSHSQTHRTSQNAIQTQQTQSQIASQSQGNARGGVTWKELDAKFRRDLPDEVYAGRLAYRGLVMRACPRVRLLDGVEVSAKERDKAERFLEGVGEVRRRAAGGAA